MWLYQLLNSSHIAKETQGEDIMMGISWCHDCTVYKLVSILRNRQIGQEPGQRYYTQCCISAA